MNDRRKWPRIALGMRIVFRFDQREDLSHHSTIRDISLGGVFIVTDKIRPKGTPVRLLLEFYDGAVFRAQGRVARVVPPEIAAMKGIEAGIGVEFTDVDQRSRELLEATLASHQTGELTI